MVTVAQKQRTLVTIQIAGGGQLHFAFRVNSMGRSPIDALDALELL